MKRTSQRDTTPKNLPAILDVLRKADYEIGTVGWIQGKMHTDDGFCMLGAVNHPKVFSGAPQWWALRYLEDAVGSTSIVDWNDAPGRTKRQVEAAFKKAIKQVKKEIANGKA